MRAWWPSIAPQLARTWRPGHDFVPTTTPGLRSDYWLATDPDLLFSDQLFAFLAGGLGPHVRYRLDRYDVGCEVPKDCSVGEQLAFCAKHVIAWHGLDASVDFPTHNL